MAGNSFGKQFQITTFGESHGKALGGVIDGIPAGLELDLNLIQEDLDRRRPGQSNITTERKESDRVQLLSGIVELEEKIITTGAPIGFTLENNDSRSSDYKNLDYSFRPSHADYTYDAKYGLRAVAGGGRSSARETASRVVGGSIARQLLNTANIEISAYVERVGDLSVPFTPQFFNRTIVDSNIVRCPSEEIASRMVAKIEAVKTQGDSLGGAIVVVAKNVPAGLGEPVFDKLDADISKALMSIPATKGLEIGAGLSGSLMKGSQHNDEFTTDGEGGVKTASNRSGGIQGGISNGEDIIVRVWFKPTSTILKEQNTVDSSGKPVKLKMEGRHDPCVMPRAVAIVEAMLALTLADHYLRNRTSKI
jgi:chorismate synthase